MKIVRSIAGKNDFSITGLTTGKLTAISRALTCSQLTQIGCEVRDFMERQNVHLIEDFGDSHLEVRASDEDESVRERLIEYVEELAAKEFGLVEQVPVAEIIDSLREIISH